MTDRRPPLPTCSSDSPTWEIRDRLVRLGPDVLSPAELLSMLLPARGRARELLHRFGGLRGLAAAEPGELRVRGGLGTTSSLRIAAAFALGRLVHAAPLRRGQLLRTSADIGQAFGDRLRDMRKERFLCVMLDGRNRIMREDLVTEGILTASLVHPREVFAPAIREAAAAIVLVHNHPSGDPEPSPEDLEITRRLASVGELVGIRVQDHVVIGDGGYVSFRERGLP